MSKLQDLIDILKNLEELENLINQQKATIDFAKAHLQNLSNIDDEERLKNMLSSSEHDFEILKPYYDKLKEKYYMLLESAKADSKVLEEVETTRVPEEYKKIVSILKRDLSSQNGYEKPEE